MDSLFSYPVQNKYVHVILQQNKLHRDLQLLYEVQVQATYQTDTSK